MYSKMLGVAVLALFLGGCAGMTGEQIASEETDPADENSVKYSKLNEMQMRIEMVTSESSCTSDFQCRTIAVGKRPCGGPEAFYAYSASNADTTTLIDMVSEYNRVQSSISVKRPRSAECRVITDPGARCVNQRCILKFIPN